MPVTRTQALPKNTLFGSVLENIKPHEVQRILDEEVTRRQLVSQNAEPSQNVESTEWIPESYIQTKMNLEKEQMELNRVMRQGKENLRNIGHRVADLESMRKYGFLHEINPRSDKVSRRSSELQSKSPSSSRSPSSSIQTIFSSHGNVPYKGGTTYSHTFTNCELPAALRANGSDQNGFQLSELEKRKFRIIQQMGPTTYVNKNGLSVPRNIVHQFGSEQCNDLLQDETMESVRSVSTTAVRPRTHSKSQQLKNLREPQLPPLNTYADLGRYVRYNVTPGLDLVKHESLMKRSYLPLERALCDPVPDEHRYRWDNVSRWAEANILQQRVWKAWDENNATKTKPGSQN